MLENSQFGYVKGDKVFLKGNGNLPDREIGVVKESEDASIRYFIERYEKVKQKIEDVAKNIEESANKGSYLMKLVHMKEYLSEYNAVGDFEKLYARIAELEDNIRDYVNGNRQKNLSLKQTLLNEARELKDSVEWDETAEKFKDLKMRWIRTGSAEKDFEDNLCTEFDEILDGFFARRKAFFEDVKKVENDKIRLYNRLIYELRGINMAQNKTPDHRARVVAIQKEWKAVGDINKWKYVKIWKKYKREVDRFFGNPYDPSLDTPPRISRPFDKNRSFNKPGSYQGQGFQRPQDGSNAGRTPYPRNDRPPYDGQQRPYEQRPRYERTDRPYEQRPNYERPNEQRPNYERPNYEQRPNYERPNYEQRPNYERPNYERPNYERGDKPAYQNRQQNYEQKNQYSQPQQFVKKELAPEEILEQKRKYCEQVEYVCDNEPNIHFGEIKKVQNEWKTLGFIPNNPIDRELNNRFRTACNEIFEHGFLVREAREKIEGFDNKTRFEQLKVKVKLLKESIRTEEMTLQQLERSNPSLVGSMPGPNQTPEQTAYQNQINKIKTKKRLARKMQTTLDSGYLQ